MATHRQQQHRMDFYGGFKNTVGDFGYDVGLLPVLLRAPGCNNPNTLEGYVAGSYSFLTLKYSHPSATCSAGWAARTPATSI